MNWASNFPKLPMSHKPYFTEELITCVRDAGNSTKYLAERKLITPSGKNPPTMELALSSPHLKTPPESSGDFQSGLLC